MDVKIYTAGKMGGLSYGEQMCWREELEMWVNKRVEQYGSRKMPRFIHPPLFYSYEKREEKSDKEVLLWEFGQISQSQIVVVNLDGILSSAGTLMELGAVAALNQKSSNYIMVIGIGKAVDYPWVNEVLLRREDTIEDAATYIARYGLV